MGEEKSAVLFQNRLDRHVEPKAVEILHLPQFHTAQH